MLKLSPKRVRLAAGWIVVPLFVVLARPTIGVIAAGCVLAVVGAAIRAWAAGTIHKNKTLTTNGPYAFTRNPLYLGSFLIGLGLATASGRPSLIAVFLVLFAAVYGWTMRAEAQRLERRFGELYREYAEVVPLFVPRLRPYGSASALRGFRLDRYLRHAEYEAALGIVVTLLALVAKMALL